MIHHDQRPYEVALAEAATETRARFERMIDGGRKQAVEVLQRIQEQRPVDAIARGGDLLFGCRLPEVEQEPETFAGIVIPRNVSPLALTVEAPEIGRCDVHPHALGQLCDRARLPQRYASRLMEATSQPWGAELLRDSLTRIFTAEGERHLLRCIDPATGKRELRGVLSDRYRRLDSRPLVTAFVEAARAYDAVPCDGFTTDVRSRLMLMLPRIFEPLKNEPMLVGLTWGNSDFGAGAHVLSLTIVRLWCTNKQIGADSMRNVHVGKRIADGGIQYSARTMQLDTQATASAIKDVVASTIAPAAIDATMQAIAKSADEPVAARDLRGLLARRNLTKQEVESVEQVFNGPSAPEIVPDGQTMWRLSNAISWVAGRTDNRERAIDLMEIAGALVLPAAKVA